VSGPILADALVAGAWLLLVGDLLRAARRACVAPSRRVVAVLLLIGIVAAGRHLEGATGGRLLWHPAVAAAGVLTAWLGVGLHLWARRSLAGGWSSVVTPPPGASLTEHGPYARIRHPLYAAILLLGLGTLAAHCSRATLAAGVGMAIGIGIKRRAEDRALEQRFGERWRTYARRVPALWPRLTRGTR
jgi:protein-S-isoprenylcysteine O-methyltransferase Ste14